MSSIYITNINRVLKSIKSDIMADFIQKDQVGIIIITNKVASSLDLQMIKKYIKNANLINTENVDTPYLSQFKSYLKIIGISCFLENTNVLLLADVVETIIKENYIFNNIMVAFRLQIIKVLPKSDIAII